MMAFLAIMAATFLSPPDHTGIVSGIAFLALCGLLLSVAGFVILQLFGSKR